MNAAAPTDAPPPPHPSLPLGVTAVMLPDLDFAEQVALCAELGVTHYVYRPRIIADDQRSRPYSNWGNHKFDLTPQRLLDEGPALRATLKEAGLTPYGTVPSLTTAASDEELSLGFRGAVAAGAGCVRVSPAGVKPGVLFDFSRTRDELVARYRDALAIADDAGLGKIVIEIHTGLPTPSAGTARHVLDPFDPARIGAILDLPNLAKEGFTAPGVSISALGDYLDHAHVGGCRRSPGQPDAAGFRPMVPTFCCLRESDLYVPDWLRLVTRLGRAVPLIVEDFEPGMTGEQRLRRTVKELRDLGPLLNKNGG